MSSVRSVRHSSRKNTMRIKVLGNNIIKKDDTKGLSRKDVLRDLAAKHEDLIEPRMFTCDTCDRIWWRRVRIRKPVSKCRKCHLKYEAIPIDQEYGWCKYYCKNCHREFSGHGAMGRPSESPCYRCLEPCYPYRVVPSGRRGPKKSSSNHRCMGHNCFNNHGQRRAKGMCAHPKSNRKKVLIASKRHLSTGSTQASILTEGDLDSDTSTRMELSDIEEED